MSAARARLLNWRAAMLLGLVTSTFSTVVSTLVAMRLGRYAPTDWMIVASIPFRDPALQIEPSGWVILAGILFHQWADFSWTVVFFGLLGRWTARLEPLAIIAMAAPWALFTSASEWLFLVPILPFWQPIFTLEQVYWLGFFVHLTSASMYPLFPYVRDRLAGPGRPPHARFAAGWSGAALAGCLVLSGVAIASAAGREPAWQGGDPAFDQAFMRQMAAHHSQGVELAVLASDRAQDPHLRALARMMASAQGAEIKVFGRWWRSWFSGDLPAATPEEHMQMPGMLSQAQLDGLRRTPGPEFDAAFVNLMSIHHRGAIAMADRKLQQPGDLRLKVMAHAIRHEQTGEIALMHGVKPGPAVLRIALHSLFAPPGDNP
jgi:uncharacterized protein (DUF305 family)